jgi:hypothetical protein
VFPYAWWLGLDYRLQSSFVRFERPRSRCHAFDIATRTGPSRHKRRETPDSFSGPRS